MHKEHSKLVKCHFENECKKYDELIRKIIPKYAEMTDWVVGLVDFQRDRELNILDLGIGTGQTALHLLKKFPNAKLDGVDISPKMMGQAKIRLKNYLDRVTFSEQDMKDLIVKKRYDACVAILSIHHLDEKQKPALFKKIFDSLNENGIFVISDLVKFDSVKETKEKEDEWKSFLSKNFAEKEAQHWFENYQKEDLPSSVSDQLRWLKSAGFKETKCVWEHMNCAVFFGRK